LRATSFHPNRQELAFAGAWIVAITASATFWTLFTRSMVGGVALNIGVQSFISFTIPWANLADWLRARGYLAPGKPIVPATVTFLFLCYAGVMVWLGGRTLARFQATGGMASDDLLMAGPDVTSGALAGWLRCRPVGAVLNLIRKELRILRPVWLISLLAAVGWACLTLFGLLHERGFSRSFETTVVGMGVVSTLMVAILAGSMSLGEERTSGAHSWHLTLPMSASRQWLVKLSMALFAGIVGAVVLPALIAGRFLFGPSRILADVSLGVGWLLGVLILTFTAFWCACAVTGTARATLWVLPVMSALILANVFGVQAAQELMGFVFLRFVPTISLKFFSAVSNNWRFYRHATLVQTLWWTPALVFAVIQSYRMFRKQLQESPRFVVRRLFPLVMMAFLCSFAIQACFSFEDQTAMQKWTLIFESNDAIEKMISGAPNMDATHPLQLTGDDLAKAWPLSESTRRWLHNARITVVTDKTHAVGQSCWGSAKDITLFYYVANVHLASGSDLVLSYQCPHDPSNPCGYIDYQLH
jgi:hypothetical protein